MTDAKIGPEICLCTIILPRLEVFFLEEWIDHHLSLGVSEIYIYNNGFQPVADDDAHWLRDLPAKERSRRASLSSAPKHLVWDKKPHLEYSPEHSDEWIMRRLKTIINKHPQVKLIPWVYGPDHHYGYPTSQLTMFRDAIQRKTCPWLLNIDPDEFIVLKQHDSLQRLIDEYSSFNLLRFYGKLFSGREKSLKTREIYKTTGNLWVGGAEKWLAKVNPSTSIFHLNPHNLRFNGQQRKEFKTGKTIYFHHYKNEGGLPRDQIDKTMQKYL